MKKNKHVNYIHFQCISSTSTWCKENAALLDPHQITCVTAQEQTAARGTFQKKWISPKEVNLYASYYFCVPQKSPFISNLGQILCISCCKLLKELGFSPTIKWPNDILLEGKKVAGILCETTQVESLCGEDLLSIVLGIGLNVNMEEEMLKEISQPATSLKILTKQDWSIEEVLKILSAHFLEDLDVLQSQGFAPFHTMYEDSLAFKGTKIKIKDGSRMIEGTYHSTTLNGNLVLVSDKGEKTEVWAGSMVFS